MKEMLHYDKIEITENMIQQAVAATYWVQDPSQTNRMGPPKM